MIDQFSKEQFEQALDNIMPLSWLSLGLELNEYCYVIEVNSNARIHIRSSVGASGIADEVGKDSIRLNLEVWQPDFRRNEHYEWIALPKKAVTSQRWVTRVSGWQKRLEEKIRLYWNVAKEFRQPIEFCSCGKSPYVGVSKSKKNEGRPYSSCLEKYGGCGLFVWLDEPLEGKVEFDANRIQISNNTQNEISFSRNREIDRGRVKSNISLQARNGKQHLLKSSIDKKDKYSESRGMDLQSLPQESQEIRIVENATSPTNQLEAQVPSDDIPILEGGDSLWSEDTITQGAINYNQSQSSPGPLPQRKVLSEVLKNEQGVENDSLSLQSVTERVSSGNSEETQATQPVQNADIEPEDTLSDNNPKRDTSGKCLPEVLEDSKESEVKDGNNSIQVSKQTDEMASIRDEASSRNDVSSEIIMSEGTSPARIDRADNESARDGTDRGNLLSLPQQKEPNPKQLEAITAPIDANVRVLAPPGSGKTFVIEQRYKYLVDNGVDPDNILVVTFSKSMADEMATRILGTCPFANVEQISTIHAFCYRLLTKWDKGGDYYGWRVAGGKDSPVKSWEIKKWIDALIADEWGIYEEKPGYAEILNWIDTSKYHGFRADNNCLEWFIDTLGLLYGQRLYNIRKRFDNALYQRTCMTFADMLLLTELKLKEDFAFRVWCQDKFSHVIIDEGQDTAYNAMRILITIAAESGEESV